MLWSDWRKHLFPGDAEKDGGFRTELDRQSATGLRAIGTINISVALFMILARFVVDRDPATLYLRLIEGAIIISLGIVLLAVARSKWVQEHGRQVGIGFGFLTGSILIWFSLYMCELNPEADDFIPSQMTMVLLVGIAALPLRPMQTMSIGFSMLGMYAVLSTLAYRVGLPVTGVEAKFVLFIFMLTMLSTALTAIVYGQRAQSYDRFRQAQEAQRRMMLSENAASMGRLAAALSHELNSPIGALSSGVDTLVLLSARQNTAPMDPARFVSLLNDLRRTVQDAAGRLTQIVNRMQRIANLDRSEVQKIKLHELLNDVVTLSDARIKQKAALEIDLQELPAIICKPQQLSAVFRNLISNSLDAVNGNGRIRIASRLEDENIAIEIADNGKGMSADEVRSIFDPGFQVKDGRVATGNWNMFSSRQVVREHGGEIAIDSLPGQGTTVRLTFPLQKLSLS